MAERKATNKYYPPDWDPSKGLINKHKRSHPLRDRARKIDQGILVVRFELPFNIWCLKCDNHVAMGVRYNAEKSKVGNYYSTPIYKFKMKCHLCDNHFEIQTDPAKLDYVILAGARKQVRESTSNDDDLNNLNKAPDDEEAKRRLTDAMFRLEKKIESKIQQEAELPGLNELKESRSRWKDSFAANQLMRKQFRTRRKRIEQKKEKDKDLAQRACLKISLKRSSEEDTLMAKKLFKAAQDERLINSEEKRKKNILSSTMIPKSIKTETRVGDTKKDEKYVKHPVRIKKEPG